MNISRRDFVKNLGAASVGGVLVGFGSGCKYVPSAEQVALIALPVGKAAGLVCNQCKIDDKSRAVIIEIMGKVRSCVPATGESFYDKWISVAKEHTQILIDRGDITKEQGELIVAAFTVVAKGVDYLFIRLNPKVRMYTDLVLAGVGSFCDGFLTTFKPANGECDDCTLKAVGVDADAYRFLLKYKF